MKVELVQQKEREKRVKRKIGMHDERRGREVGRRQKRLR
jgi:hypothetical protein